MSPFSARLPPPGVHVSVCGHRCLRAGQLLSPGGAELTWAWACLPGAESFRGDGRGRSAGGGPQPSRTSPAPPQVPRARLLTALGPPCPLECHRCRRLSPAPHLRLHSLLSSSQVVNPGAHAPPPAVAEFCPVSEPSLMPTCAASASRQAWCSVPPQLPLLTVSYSAACTFKDSSRPASQRSRSFVTCPC